MHVPLKWAALPGRYGNRGLWFRQLVMLTSSTTAIVGASTGKKWSREIQILGKSKHSITVFLGIMGSNHKFTFLLGEIILNLFGSLNPLFSFFTD